MTVSTPIDFEQLYREHYKKIRALVLSFGFKDAKADDVIQDVFVAAWEKLDSLKEPKAFPKWLMAIARNRCLQEVRGKRQFISLSPSDANGEEEMREIVLEATDDMESMRWEMSLSLLRELIQDHQGEPRASIAKLFYLENLSIKEICLKLALKQNTVLSHLHRFRLVIAEAMAELLEQRSFSSF